MIDWDWVFLGIGGFLLGSVAYVGWHTTRYEPQAKPGYALIGIGTAVVVAVNTWLDFIRDTSGWFRISTILGYVLVAAGLVSIVRERRRRGH